MNFLKSFVVLVCLLVHVFTASAQLANKQLLPAIVGYLQTAEKRFDSIAPDRKIQLAKLSAAIKSSLSQQHQANLIFICTHNSRRSHIGQLWAAAAAEYYGIKGINSFSGGTESTAFNPRAIKALTDAGFQINKAVANDTAKNPRYNVAYAANRPSIVAFSKKYTDTANPQTGFIAVMTCSQADAHCPIVQGATARVAIPYEDPKQADGTPEEAIVYQQRCQQIATEVLYTFFLLKHK